MSAIDDYKMFLNVLANDEDGIAGDLINKWAKTKAMVHTMEQGKMMPSPMPPEPTEPTMSQGGEAPLMSGKYDEL
jgi:hypothetical protein